MSMKVYSIGREVGCDIVINDNTDVISRRHAVLNVMSSGKMTIVDSSHNGTYVNGIRISPNVPVPVTRKDNVSFAHVARLDWNLIPKPTSITQYIIYGIIALVVVGGAIGTYFYLSNSDSNAGIEPVGTEKIDTLKSDQQTTKKDAPDTEVKEEKEKAESADQKPEEPKKTGGKRGSAKGGKNTGTENKQSKEKPNGNKTEVSNGARH